MGGAGSRGPRAGRCGGPGIRFGDGWRCSAPVGAGRRTPHMAAPTKGFGASWRRSAAGSAAGSAHGSAQVGGVGAGALFSFSFWALDFLGVVSTSSACYTAARKGHKAVAQGVHVYIYSSISSRS
jgi:hypothetical protein